MQRSAASRRSGAVEGTPETGSSAVARLPASGSRSRNSRPSGRTGASTSSVAGSCGALGAAVGRPAGKGETRSANSTPVPTAPADRDELQLPPAVRRGIARPELDESRALDLIGRRAAQFEPVGKDEIRRHQLLAVRCVVACPFVHAQQRFDEGRRLVECSRRGGQCGGRGQGRQLDRQLLYPRRDVSDPVVPVLARGDVCLLRGAQLGKRQPEPPRVGVEGAARPVRLRDPLGCEKSVETCCDADGQHGDERCSEPHPAHRGPTIAPAPPQRARAATVPRDHDSGHHHQPGSGVAPPAQCRGGRPPRAGRPADMLGRGRRVRHGTAREREGADPVDDRRRCADGRGLGGRRDHQRGGGRSGRGGGDAGCGPRRVRQRVRARPGPRAPRRGRPADCALGSRARNRHGKHRRPGIRQRRRDRFRRAHGGGISTGCRGGARRPTSGRGSASCAPTGRPPTPCGRRRRPSPCPRFWWRSPTVASTATAP